MMDINNRILVVDDNPSIHEDFHKIFRVAPGFELDAGLKALERALFDEEGPADSTDELRLEYEIDSAFQGREALEKVRAAESEGRPYAVVFMDVRMPPGWDGVETIQRIWAEYPYVEMVIVTAYSDYSWEEVLGQVGQTDRLLWIKKPFEAVAVKQMAMNLTRKWTLVSLARKYLARIVEEIDHRIAQVGQLEEVLREL